MSGTRLSWGGRLAAGWERAEPTVTRLFLAVVFGVGLVAQFVKPVGDALQDKVYLGGALLTVVGYVLYAEVQRLNAAHSTQRETEESLAAVVRRLDDEVQRLSSTLRPRAGSVVTSEQMTDEFREALEVAGRVQLTAMGFTGENFAGPLVGILQRLNEAPLRKVELRILVPDFAREIELPGRVGEDGRLADCPRFREDLRQKIANHERTLRGHIGRMDHARRGTLEVEFRALHMSPSLKLYFINNDVVYEGIYDKIELRPDPWAPVVPAQPVPESDAGQLVDLIGSDSLLARWSRDGGDHACEIIRRRGEFFETLWDKAHPLSPTPRPPLRPDAS